VPTEDRSKHSESDSQVSLVTTATSTYALERYIPRAALNILGQCLFTALYLFIVLTYLLRPAVNDVIPWLPIEAKGVFYAWLVLSIFVLDWAKSSLAGFEGSCLMKDSLAPRNAMQLMWHADRTWGSISGWWRALVLLYDNLRHRAHRNAPYHVSEGPGRLWWYLSLSSFLLYAAVPLAGLSMDPKDALKVGNRTISILGTNQTNFDMQSSNSVAEAAKSRWRQGNPTTPHGETIFYAPAETKSASNIFYEDAIQSIYNNTRAANHSVAFFSGPQVSERAHGRVWGLLTNLSCSVVHPYKGLKLLQVRAIDNWTAPGLSSTDYGGANHLWDEDGGLTPSHFDEGSSFGVDYKYLIASNLDVVGSSDYTNSSSFPTNGFLELVMWQAYKAQFTADAIFLGLASHPSVVSSVWRLQPFDNMTYLGYAISCGVDSMVGFAELDAAAHTYSNFSPHAAEQNNPSLLGDYGLNQYPGILAIQSLVFGAFTTIVLKVFAPPVCDETGGLGPTTCNPWYSANVATGGSPIYIHGPDDPKAGNLQYPTISPQRLNLAIYKLFGEVAIGLMASGPGTWTGGLSGLDYASDLVPGRVPWQVVLALLAVWTLLTALPNLWTFTERRWAGTLDGFEMFRLGAEWREMVQKFEGREFGECKSLQELPGMIGDMEPCNESGFIGLSRNIARREKRMYVHDRGALG
jgi:hypothetical protein